MQNGTYMYDLEMTTPLGKRRGQLELMVWDHFLNGYLTMFTRTILIRNGVLEGSHISFEGDMKTFMDMIPYHADGTVTSLSIDLIITTAQGNYPVIGTKRS